MVQSNDAPSSSQVSPLDNCRKPLFFAVANPEELGLAPPANRRGEAICTWVRSLSVMQKEALVVSSHTGRAWRLASDEGAYLMGQDAAPCPLSFFTVGMVSSFMNELQALAKMRGIKLRDVQLTQDNYYTMTGSALRGTMVGGALPVHLAAEIDSDSDSRVLTSLVPDAVAASPINGLMGPVHASQFTLTHNGRAIEVGRVDSLDRIAETDPGHQFDSSRPAAGNWNDLVSRNGMTPKADETTSTQGSSLADSQDRRLHLQGICVLRNDGVKQIEQRLYNPHGSIFHFLSDEDGRAPEANAYASAGVGFCFMTQFGRYAKIAKKELAEYRIVQDTHFSLGGASSGTGKPGESDRIETHVYLKTPHDDDLARQVLDMSEQTCFLHAFCRTNLKTSIRTRQPRTAALS